MKIDRKKLTAAMIIVVILSVAFFWGGSASDQRSGDTGSIEAGDTESPGGVTEEERETGAKSGTERDIEPEDDEALPVLPSADVEIMGEAGQVTQPGITAAAGGQPEEDVQTGAVTGDENPPELTGSPAPEETEAADPQLTCTLTVSCGAINNNISLLNPDKLELVPSDGIILSMTAAFSEGESVFDLLLREMKNAAIHFEFVKTVSGSAYIEGINNIYEFDCGPLSGWMYKVNGWFPNYGCSGYQLKDGDVVELIYTCDLGADVGGEYSAGKQI